MSVLINAKPTAEVVADSPFVRVGHGRVVVLQPTPITIVGTAQPPSGNFGTVIEVFGLDADGNVLNNSQPLTTTTTNFLGRYNATFELPTSMRATVNSIIVRQRATGFLDGSQTIDATTLTGLTGDLAIDGTTLENVQGNLAIGSGTISNLQGDISINGFESDIDGTVAETEGLTDEIFGTLEIDIDLVGAGVGEFESDGPVEFTVFETELTGTVSTPNLSGSLSGGTADESSRTGTLSDGTGTILPTAGTFTQTGEAIIAPTTGTIRLDVDEFAVSDPIEIFLTVTDFGGEATCSRREKRR